MTGWSYRFGSCPVLLDTAAARPLGGVPVIILARRPGVGHGGPRRPRRSRLGTKCCRSVSQMFRADHVAAGSTPVAETRRHVGRPTLECMVTTDGPAEQQYPGRRLGLPADGLGSVASMGRRIAAFVIDIVLSALVAWAFTAPEPPQNASLIVWAVVTVVTVGLFGFSPGQAALGIRVVPIGGGIVRRRLVDSQNAVDLPDRAAAVDQRGLARTARPVVPHHRAAHPVRPARCGPRGSPRCPGTGLSGAASPVAHCAA